MYDIAERASPPPWVITRTTAVLVPAAAASLALLVSVSREALSVVAPLVCIGLLVVGLIAHLYQRDRQLPIFDVGAVTLLVTAVYSAVPLLGFWLGGLRWTPYSYTPLWVHSPTPPEVGAFAWRHVLYLYSFATAYLVFRGRSPIVCAPTRRLRRSAVVAIGILLLGLIAYFQAIRVLFGVSYHPSYADLMAAAASAEALPHLVRQISHNLYTILALLKIAAVLWVMGRWRDWRWRAALIVFLAVEGIMTVTLMGGRTWYAMLLMSAVLLYHRMVKPFSVMQAGALVVVLFGGALVYGVARDVGGGLRAVAEAEWAPWATMNEFQAIFGIAYDLYAREAAGAVGPVPWQIYVSDLLSLVPSQLLPFAKSDPCMGYPIVDGVGLGCVMGVVAQAVIGLDWVELLLRGLGLGLLYAVIHRWYARHQSSFWATLLYLCLAVWGYYTFRGSSFYFLYNVLYRFVPMLVAVRLVQLGVRNIRVGRLSLGP